ncbi:DUF1707 domain-containing protein [Phytomonospora sp. NPDC050363]|uniref:DUF1707 SHOCT-like domain-containing protein n=1 Tax=Phytomonospora sp. NPDC050363 TaxID=3155642 RepID=UPI0034081B5D
MNGELARRDLRISNADRERVIEHLQACTGDGRLDLDEFAQRVDAVYAARTFGDLEPVTADLPRLDTPDTTPVSTGTLDIKTTGSALKRGGRWLVPRRLNISGKGASIKLDLTEAVIPHTVVDVGIDTWGSSVSVVLPKHATADDADISMIGSSAKNHARADGFEGTGTPLHFVFHGKLKGSSLTVRHKRRFLWWTY